jgi:hypothetical protein
MWAERPRSGNFVEQAFCDAVRRQRGVMAKSAASAESALFVEPDRCRLKPAGFETQYRPVGGARLLLDTREQCLSDTASSGALAGVHALDFGIGVEQRDGAAADRLPIEPRHEEPDMRLEHLLDR